MQGPTLIDLTIRNLYFLRSSSQVKQLRLTPCQNKNRPDKKRQWYQLYPIFSLRNHNSPIIIHNTNNKQQLSYFVHNNIFIFRRKFVECCSFVRVADIEWTFKCRRACGHVDVGMCPHQVLAATLLNPISTRGGRFCPPYTGVHTKF